MTVTGGVGGDGPPPWSALCCDAIMCAIWVTAAAWSRFNVWARISSPATCSAAPRLSAATSGRTFEKAGGTNVLLSTVLLLTGVDGGLAKGSK